MSLMENTMGYIMGKMSLERKQDMMLNMMPMMMKDVNMAETMLKMMPQMLDQISLLDIFNLLKKLFCLPRCPSHITKWNTRRWVKIKNHSIGIVEFIGTA